MNRPVFSHAPLSVAPDPCVSMFGLLTTDNVHSKGRAWISQRRRRSEILAAARALWSEAGLDGVHVRAIADRCNVAPQTIYNIVGDKSAVMEQAAADWLEAIHVAAITRSPQADVNPAFLILEMFWDSAVAHSAFVLNASRNSSTPRDPLNRVFYETAIAGLESELRRLTTEGALRSDADVSSLARQLTCASHASICNWCARGQDVAAYAIDLTTGPGAMLRAWLQGPELFRLERYSSKRERALRSWPKLPETLPV